MNNAPCKGNSLIIRLLPLQGVGLVLGIFTQGAALGYVVLPFQGVQLATFDTHSTKKQLHPLEDGTAPLTAHTNKNNNPNAQRTEI